MGAYAAAARRRAHLAAVLLRPPSGHRPGKRQTRHARILQVRAPHGATTKHSGGSAVWSSPWDPVGRVPHRESRYMPVEAQWALTQDR